MEIVIKKIYKKIAAVAALISIELIAVWAVFAGSLVVFTLVWAKFIHFNEIAFDNLAFEFLSRRSSNGITQFMKVISFMASLNFLLVAATSLFLYLLFFRKHKWYSIKTPVVALGSISLNLGLKYLFNRPRPQLPLVETAGLSFPSGHAMMAYSFYGLLIYLVWKEVPNKYLRNTICIALIVLIHLIGLSRVYLRVHYASDVMAGFALGVFWLIASIGVLKKIEKATQKKLIHDHSSLINKENTGR